MSAYLVDLTSKDIYNVTMNEDLRLELWNFNTGQ